MLIAIVLGVLFGWASPEYAKSDWVKAMGDGFIKLIKMVIAPIIFCTIVSGISHIQDAKKVGRVGLKALDLLRGRLDLRAHRRPDHRQCRAARRGLLARRSVGL